MAIDYGELKTEIETDPLGLGYSSCPPGNDQCIADIMNSLETGREGPNSDPVESRELYELFDLEEYKSILTASTPSGDTERLANMMRLTTLRLTDPNVVGAVEAAFGSESTTFANLTDAQTIPIGRSVELWGVPVTNQDVAIALRETP